MNYVLILGAKSDIAKACAREYASNGYNLYLAGRNISELEEFKQDLIIRSDQKIELIRREAYHPEQPTLL